MPYRFFLLLFTIHLALFPQRAMAAPIQPFPKDSIKHSTQEEALAYLATITEIKHSAIWPNIDPELLLRNLNFSIRGPLRSFEGKNTNFCAYTALSYLVMKEDPKGFVDFILELYQTGKAKMGKKTFTPSKAVREKAGLIQYKGQLDVNHLGQMWFLTLADQIKGYLNVFNRKYDDGDEDKMWASTNFAKFNRMMRKIFPHRKVKARGSDLIRPSIENLYAYLESQLEKGVVFLYLNNRLLYKKKHDKSRLGIPTHFVVLIDIYKVGDKINIIYWDSGRKTLQQVSEAFLREIIFGITTSYE